eukprot:4524096-Alexandrium_andersonii.AAC.1
MPSDLAAGKANSKRSTLVPMVALSECCTARTDQATVARRAVGLFMAGSGITIMLKARPKTDTVPSGM